MPATCIWTHPRFVFFVFDRAVTLRQAELCKSMHLVFQLFQYFSPVLATISSDVRSRGLRQGDIFSTADMRECMFLENCVYCLLLAITSSGIWMNEWMNEWMDGWMDGWMNEWMDGWNEWMKEWRDKWMSEWMDEWMNEWMNVNEWMNEWMNEWNEWMNEWVNEWMSEWKNEWMNEWTNERTVEQINKSTNPRN